MKESIGRTLRGVTRSRITAAAAGGVAVLMLGGGTAVAAGHISGDDIQHYSITKQHLKKNSVGSWEVIDRSLRGGELKKDSVGRWVFTPYLRGLIEDVENSDRVSGLESDGPYPGATQLQEGSNSTKKWAGDEGASLQRSWVRCPDGKKALGGGYSRADEGVEAYKNLQIVTSQPAQVENGDPNTYNPIEGDPDGSYVPNAWLVEGFNNGTTEMIVRPHVTCVAIN